MKAMSRSRFQMTGGAIESGTHFSEVGVAHTVGAVCDRPFFVECGENGPSQSARAAS
jgi:hypothetical protein